MSETEQKWVEYTVSGDSLDRETRSPTILLATNWTTEDILFEIVRQGFLPPPFSQYKLGYDSSDDWNLEIRWGAKRLKLARTGYEKPMTAKKIAARTPVPTLKRWFDILFQKTLLIQDHEKLSPDLLRHLFVSTIQHLQLGHSLIAETRKMSSIADREFADPMNFRPAPQAPPIPPTTQVPPQEDKPVKPWWASGNRFAIFADLAKQVICAAYDRALHQVRWRNRETSPLSRYLQNTIRLGKMNNHPKFNNPPKWDTLPNAAETFTRSLQLALRSPAANLETSMGHNLSHLLADLEKKLGLYPGFSVDVPKEAGNSDKTKP